MDAENKKKFEVRIRKTPDGFFQRDIFVDGEFFDWSIDEESFEWARKQGPEFFEATKKDIAKHFLESLSEFVGRRVTPGDFQKATKTGFI